MTKPLDSREQKHALCDRIDHNSPRPVRLSLQSVEGSKGRKKPMILQKFEITMEDICPPSA